MSHFILGAENKLPNPSFETGTHGWGNSGGTTVLLDTTNKWAGSQSIKLTLTSVASTQYLATPSTFADARSILVTPGEFISFKFRALGSTATLQSAGQFTFYTSGNVQVGSDVIGTATALSTTEYTEITLFDVEVPATAAFVRVFMRIETAGAAVSNWVSFDGADFRTSTTVDTYVDGDQGDEYGWKGTAHDSISYRNAVQMVSTKGRRGAIHMTPKLYLATKLNELREDISDYIVDGFVEMNFDREIKMTFKGRVTHPNLFTPYSDYLAPFIRLQYSNGDVVEEQLGLFSIEPSPRESAYSHQIGEFDAKDLTWNLSQTVYLERLTISAGQNYVERVINILLDEGFTRYSIPASDKTLPKTITWPEDATKLQVINDLLYAIGYYSLTMDRQGVLTSFPFRKLNNVEPSLDLITGNDSIIVGSIREEPLNHKIYNHVKVVKEDLNNKANSFSISLRNYSGNSPVSELRLGRRMSLVINDTKIESSTVAEEIARRALEEAAAQHTNYTISTLPVPNRGLWEVYNAEVYTRDNVDVLRGKVWADAWDIGFTPNTATMKHYVHRLEDYE
jgi:hypothetical protein